MPLYHLKNLVNFKLMTHKIIQSGTGDQCLNIMNTIQKVSLPVAVQL